MSPSIEEEFTKFMEAEMQTPRGVHVCVCVMCVHEHVCVCVHVYVLCIYTTSVELEACMLIVCCVCVQACMLCV